MEAMKFHEQVLDENLYWTIVEQSVLVVYDLISIEEFFQRISELSTWRLEGQDV